VRRDKSFRNQRKKQKRGQRKPQSPPVQTAYFIKRRSHVDDSQFLNDEGRRVWFPEAVYASWFMRLFAADQGAKIVKLPVEPEDVPFGDVLPHWLPEGVKPEEYMAAIKRTTRDVKRGREPSRAAVRAFLRRQGGKYGGQEVEDHGLD
jgi:hypothetical protein